MKHENVRERLIESVIAVGAAQGIENATTRKIAAGAGLAEAYIYQNWPDKVELLKDAFLEIRARIGRALGYVVSQIEPNTAQADYIARILWCAYWNYLVEHEEELRYFLNFHHSGYFTEEMAHRWPQEFMPFGYLMVDMDRIYHISEATNVPVMRVHIETGTLDHALAYLRGQLPQTPETVEAIYRAIMKPMLDDISVQLERRNGTGNQGPA